MYLSKSLDIEWKKIEEEILLFSFTTKSFYRLNSIGAFIWKNCNGLNTEEQILKKIISKYDVKEEKAKKDLDYFLSYLIKKRLLNKTNTPNENKREIKII